MSLLGRRSLPFLRPVDRNRVALQRGAERLLALQRADAGWEGSWRRYAGSAADATNTVGIGGLGLLEAYRVLREPAHLAGARKAAAFAAEHLGAGATHVAYHPRFTATDLIFFHRLHQLTGEEAYRIRAAEEWRNIRSYFYFATAMELHRFFQKIERHTGAWDLAFYLEAAELSGDTAWADEAAVVLSRVLESSYWEPRNEYRILNAAGAVRALAGQGYGAIHRAELEAIQNALVDEVEKENVGLSVQDTAHVAVALFTAAGPFRSLAAELARWLSARQERWGGWMEEGVQYAHVDAEAVWALALLLGRRPREGRSLGSVSASAVGRPDRRWRAVGHHDPVAPFDGE